MKFYDSRPSLSQVAGDLNAKPWPSYRKNTDYEPGGYHQTVYSGYQMFNKSQHMWVQPATGGRSYGQNMNGEDLYNTMNPSAVVPVYDVLWSQTGAGYHDDPLYSGDGLGYAMRCGGPTTWPPPTASSNRRPPTRCRSTPSRPAPHPAATSAAGRS